VLYAVIDPGVLVSALVAPKGAPGQLLDLVLEQRFELVASPRLIGELTGVLLRERFRRYASAAEVHEFVADLAAVATLVPDPPDPAPIARDPNGQSTGHRVPPPPGPALARPLTSPARRAGGRIGRIGGHRMATVRCRRSTT